MNSYRDKHYGLAGQEIRLRRRKGTATEEERLVMIDGLDPYPWGRLEVPVKITAEYPRFLVGTVLIHKGIRGWPTTGEYPITIDKFDIFSGKMIINGGQIR